MQKIREIRQGLVEARNIVTGVREVTQDQFQILEKLSSHEHYGIRRQASNLLFIVSENHRHLLLSGGWNPISDYN
jgi:hypothetical protein